MFSFSIWALRIANWLNWTTALLFALFLIFLATATASFDDKLAELFQVEGEAAARAVSTWLKWSCVLAFPIVIAVHLICTRLNLLLQDSAEGLAFTEVNADRLNVVAWALLAINLVDLIFGQLSIWASVQSGEYFGWSPTLTGWFAVLLLFLLAKVFREGDRMRQDLEGTV